MKRYIPLLVISLLGIGLLGRALSVRNQLERDANRLTKQRLEWDLDHGPASTRPATKPTTRATPAHTAPETRHPTAPSALTTDR
jgi:hypothetical protein